MKLITINEFKIHLKKDFQTFHTKNEREENLIDTMNFGFHKENISFWNDKNRKTDTWLIMKI